ncbi:hypothetical protein [Salinarimonas ramus]|uniref:Uncharacterized protein n=1 Tax=Salinarimonas ramus TaxID=690164 RepID=A0A917QCM5_9HYPH|nr:hypothetical protein [Salinarimonas ramus]GGK44146.1 hypothetical protein GCM10011322_34090 [Salinarimonas ramus]
MFAVLYALAFVMVAGGFYAAFTGWELLLLERGWSMVISGVTFATGGFVVAGIAAAGQALAKRLDAVADAVRTSRPAAQPVFPRRPGATEPDATAPEIHPPAPSAPPVPREIAPKLPPQEPASPAGPAPLAALGLGGVAAEAIAPAMEPRGHEPEGGLPPLDLGPVEEERATREEPLAEAEEEAPVPEPASAQEALPAVADHEPAVAHDEPDTQPIDGPSAGIEAPVLRPREPDTAEADVEALDRRYTEEPGVAQGPEVEPTPEADIAAVDAESAPFVEPADAEAQPADAPLADEAPVDESPASEEAETADQTPGEPPRIVGTHVSGANRYVMYSDGSIEAETPDGRLLFGSIEELKGYVASAGEDPSGTTQTGPR